MFSGIHIGFSKKNGAFVGSYFEQREGVFPEQLHIIPIVDDTVRNWVFQLVQSSLVCVQLLSNVCFQLIGCAWDHDIVFWPSDS